MSRRSSYGRRNADANVNGLVNGGNCGCGEFFQTIEKAYQQAVVRDDILALYNRFKEFVPSKSEEKQYFKEFDEKTGVSCWKTIQKAKSAEVGEKIKMI